MAQRFRASAVVAENPGVVPRPHMVAHSHLELQLQGSDALFCPPRHSTHKVHRLTCSQIAIPIK